MKIWSLVLVLLTMTSTAFSAGRPVLFRQALETILSDQASLEELEAAVNSLEKNNSGAYDLKPLREGLVDAQRVRGFESFRVLDFIKVAADIGIAEALDILIARIQARPTDHWRFDQWVQADVEAITAIADKLTSAPKKKALLRTIDVLLEKAAEAPNSEEVITSVTYRFGKIGRPEPRVLQFIQKQLGSKFPQTRMAAAYSLVDIGSIPAVLATWNKALNSETRLNLAKALFIGKNVRNDEKILQLLTKAQVTDSSPEVRQQASVILQAVAAEKGYNEMMAEMTPQKQADIYALMSELLDPPKVRACEALF